MPRLRLFCPIPKSSSRPDTRIMSEMVSCEVQIELSESRACSTQPYSTTDTGMSEAVHGMSPHNVKALRYYRTRTSNLKSPAPSRMCC